MKPCLIINETRLTKVNGVWFSQDKLYPFHFVECEYIPCVFLLTANISRLSSIIIAIGLIYPTELQLNKANSSDTEVPFLDLNLSIANGIVSSKFYDKWDYFNFQIVSFQFSLNNIFFEIT